MMAVDAAEEVDGVGDVARGMLARCPRSALTGADDGRSPPRRLARAELRQR